MTKTILLADDSLTIQKVVELTFADTPYHVVSLSSGDELLEKIGEVQPEIVICDIIMPGTDGYEVCQQIKSDPATLHLPVILLSGTFEPFDRDQAVAAGCSEIITKPFEAKRLVEAVEKLLSPSPADAGDDGAEPENFGFGDASGEGAESGAVDFGTRMAPSEPADELAQDAVEESEESIDFTTSGFAEMEAAGGPEQAEDHEAETDDLAAAGDEDFADAFSIDTPSFETTETANGGDDTDPFGIGDTETAAEEDLSDGDGPFVPDPTQTADLFEEASAVLEHEESDHTSEPDFVVQSPEEAFDTDPGPVVITDADTAPVPAVPDDTDQEYPESTDREEGAGDASPGEPATLSDEDVERIAKRVIELASDRIEQIAWEAIPDIAEIVVRERIRQLESEFETEN